MMSNYTEQDLKNLSKFSDELFLTNKEKFGQIHQIDNIEQLGAIEYLSYVIYPYDSENRIRFYNSLIWLLIKTDKSIDSKETQKYIKMMCGPRHKKLNFKNTEQNYVKASKIIEKRIQATHAYELTLYAHEPTRKLPKTFRDNLLAVDAAYKKMNDRPLNTNSMDYDPDNQLSNAKKDILRPSRGVIHLIYGFIESFFNSCPIEHRNIKSALQDPFWVNEALKVSEEHLKLRLLSNYYRKKGVKTGTNIELKYDEIVLLTK